MKIRINLEKDEIKEILKKHILKEFPVDTTMKEIEISEAYGEYTVDIFDKQMKKEAL